VSKPDALGVVEAAYTPDVSHSVWLGRLVRAAAPHLDRGDGVVGFAFDATDATSIELGKPVFAGAERPIWRGMQDATRGLSPRGVRRTYLGTRPFGSVAQRFTGKTRPIFLELSRRCYRPCGFTDLLVLHVVDATQRGCVLAAPTREAHFASRKEIVLWSRIAAHVRSAHRLQLCMLSGEGSLLDASPEAILSPSGKVEHAVGPARDRDAREALRRAAKAMDRARTAAVRVEPERALELWDELVAGRWSLIDRFDSDGRRYLVAHRNDAHVARLMSLTPREREVVTAALRGRANKVIAQELSVSESTVSEHLSIALAKLNQRSLAALMQAMAIAGTHPS
jgi:DNA-binding CsgD family transcriptional regulator